ncbi:hypothetical protein C6P42_001764, partial [Pichia californica]
KILTSSIPLNKSPKIIELSNESKYKQLKSPEISKRNIEAEIDETPEIERVQVRPGVFEIGSSPMKGELNTKNKYNSRENFQFVINDTPQRNQIIASSSPLNNFKVVESGNTSSRSTKRKLNFG